MYYTSRTGDKIVVFEKIYPDLRRRMYVGENTQHLTTKTRPLQILSRNLRIRGNRATGICWWHPERKGMWLNDFTDNRKRK